MEELVKWLNDRTREYDEGHPTVTDLEWDREYFRLQNMEAELGKVLPESPTHRIKYEVVNSLQKVEHNHAMLSAAKTKDWDEFVNYFGNKDVTGMLKLDGLTLSLRYVGGRLKSAETRGNGTIGESVLHNAIVIPSIPKIIDYTDELIVDGEVIITTKDFEPFKNEYKNQRNLAAGSIRLLNPNECKDRHLTFVVWNVVKGLDGNNFWEKLEKVDELGFTIVPWTSSFDSMDKEFLINKAKELGYPIDGLIGRFTDIEYGEGLGSTDHHSKAIFAFKFYDEEYETRLKHIEWSMGRTGVLTPVAVFEPIEIEGTIVERASLHNLSVMKEVMGDCCYAGQKITVAKMNMIIPQVMSAVKMNYGDVVAHGGITVDGFSGDYGLLCPCCGQPVGVKTSESGVKNVVCENSQCNGKLINIIDHFVSKKGLDIHGLSKQTIEKLIDWGWLNSRKDIFNLSAFAGEWKNKSGFGQKSVDNILAAIEGSKQTTLDKFISGLGIPLIGERVAKDLAKEYISWEDFRESAVKNDKFNFESLAGFGPEMNYSLKNYDYAEADEIAGMLTIMQPKVSNVTAKSGAAATYVITGKLSKKRDDIIADIEAVGGKVSSSVSSKTNYLVCNQPENTTKYKKAQELNIPIITETELYEMINS